MSLYNQLAITITCIGEESVRECLSRTFDYATVQIENLSMEKYPFQSMYAVCTDHEIVIVAIDHSWPLPGETESTTDHLGEKGEFLWKSKLQSRKSPAHTLHGFVDFLKEKIGRDDAEIHGILITCAAITNIDELTPFWKVNGIAIKDSVSNPQRYLFADRSAFPFDIETSEFIRGIDESAGPEPFESDSANDNKEDESDSDPFDDDDDLFDDFKRPWLTEQPLNAQVLPCLANPERELDALVGLRSIKDHIQRLIALNEYNKKLRSIDPECQIHTINLHGCFLGGVGTGKTTVARLMGALFAKAGMLSKGHVVVADRRTFIGRQFGCEEENLQKCIETAKGGVLLIDEAYLLVGNHHEDPGQMVLQMMLSLLADEKNRDIAVLLCGYEKEMQRIFDLNPGIVSRFPNVIKFPNYTLAELLEIARRRIKEYAYTFTPRAWQRFAEVLSAKMKGNARNWANAREVANLLEQVYVQHAQRCCTQNVPAAAMHRITAADIPTFTPTVRPRLGF